MINLKIRERKDNKLSEQNTKYECMLEHDFDSKGVEVFWSIKTSSGNVYHSYDAAPGLFLNYSQPLNPTIEIFCDKQGTYDVQILAQIKIPVRKEVEDKVLDENGKITTKNTIIDTHDFYLAESKKFKVIWDESDGDWE